MPIYKHFKNTLCLFSNRSQKTSHVPRGPAVYVTDVLITCLPLNSHEWPRQNFSLQYQYNIKQTSDENKEKYQLGDYKLIQSQILQTNITRTVWQTVGRITSEILGVKELTSSVIY